VTSTKPIVHFGRALVDHSHHCQSSPALQTLKPPAAIAAAAPAASSSPRRRSPDRWSPLHTQRDGWPANNPQLARATRSGLQRFANDRPTTFASTHPQRAGACAA
jgi:hypothetical protein